MFEAYTQAVDLIARETFSAWKHGDSHEQVMKQLARDWSVELYDCRRALTKLINDNYYNNLLSHHQA